MSPLSQNLEQYLQLRRGLGFKLRREAIVLAQFVAYLQAAGATTVTTELAIAWARLCPSGSPISAAHRLIAVRGFARYLKTIDPATEIPPAGVFGRLPQRPTPFLYSQHDIGRLIEAAGRLRPQMRAATYQTLLGLLAVTGMRVGEAFHLENADVDLDAGVLTITRTKGGNTRLLPLHSSTSQALQQYAHLRDETFPHPRSDVFFVSTRGGSLVSTPVLATFHQLTTTIGLRTATTTPRIHDLRHSFAVSCLLHWYQHGADVAANITTLSAYLGHIRPSGTYWYLSASPELMASAAQRLQQRGRRP